MPANTPLGIEESKINPLTGVTPHNIQPRPAAPGPRTFAELHAALEAAPVGGTITLTQDIASPAGYAWVPAVVRNNLKIVGNGYSIGMPEDTSRQLCAPLLRNATGLSADNFNIYVNIPNDPQYAPSGALAQTLVSPQVIGVSVSGSIYQTDTDVGGVVGHVSGASIFNRCTNSISLNSNQLVGGIAANAAGSTQFDNCANYGEVLSRASYAAGIVATISGGGISLCKNKGEIKSATDGAGIAAHATNTEISNCANHGEIIKSTAAGSMAGIVAVANNTRISQSVNRAMLRGTSTDGMGGIAGLLTNGSVAYSCHNMGATYAVAGTPGGDDNCIDCTAGLLENICFWECSTNVPGIRRLTVDNCAACTRVGGIAGRLELGSAVVECWNHALITGRSEIGGIIGAAGTIVTRRAQVLRNVNKAPVVASGDKVGGIVGQAQGNILIERNRTEGADWHISGRNYVGGIVGAVSDVGLGWSGDTVITGNRAETGHITATGMIVHRILGWVSGASAALENNTANPDILLTGTNTSLGEYEYINDPVLDGDPGEGEDLAHGLNKIMNCGCRFCGPPLPDHVPVQWLNPRVPLANKPCYHQEYWLNGNRAFNNPGDGGCPMRRGPWY